MKVRNKLKQDDGMLSIEAALTVPMVFVMFFILLQFGLWMFANIAVDQAAQQASRNIAIHGATTDDVHSIAVTSVNQVLSDTGAVKGAAVAAAVDAERRNGTVTVTGKAVPLMPFNDWSVRSTKQVALERFVNIDERS